MMDPHVLTMALIKQVFQIFIIAISWQFLCFVEIVFCAYVFGCSDEMSTIRSSNDLQLSFNISEVF